MIYRDFHGLKLSGLGFGCMRFKTDPETGEIDQEKVNAMFDLAIADGVNYFDTAYPYLDGKSELAVREALKKYPRESYYLADKFPGHSLPGPVDNGALFEISLQKCGVDYFDFYLLHNLTEWSDKVYEGPEYHIIPDLLKKKEEGKIRYFGFSCHGGPALLDDFLTRYEGVFDFVQIQCNYLDWTLQDAKEKYDIITRHGLSVFVMEPLRGGKLASLPADAHEKLKAFGREESDAAFAFRFLQGLPNVRVILSGMNEVPQVEDNLKSFAEEKPLTEEERAALLTIAEGMKNGVPCTACRYCCAGCPMELDIPYLLSCYNDYKYASSLTSSMRLDALAEEKKPAACIECGQCVHACPQGINVPEALKELAALYAEGPNWSVFSAGRKVSIRKDLNMD